MRAARAGFLRALQQSSALGIETTEIMTHGDASAMRLRQLQFELERHCTVVRAGSELEVFPFVSNLLTHLLRADHSIGADELAMLAAFHRDDFSWQDEHEFARLATHASPEFLAEVPTFVTRAVSYDRAHGTHHAFAMVELIGAMCDVVVRSDHLTTNGELRALDSLLDVLHRAVARADADHPADA